MCRVRVRVRACGVWACRNPVAAAHLPASPRVAVRDMYVARLVTTTVTYEYEEKSRPRARILRNVGCGRDPGPMAQVGAWEGPAAAHTWCMAGCVPAVWALLSDRLMASQRPQILTEP